MSSNISVRSIFTVLIILSLAIGGLGYLYYQNNSEDANVSNWGEPKFLDIDPDGNIIVFGETEDASMMDNAFDSTHGGKADAYLVKLSPEGNVYWSTFLGGRNYEVAESLQIDMDGNIYVTGYTPSNDFPTTDNAFQKEKSAGSSGDIFVSKFSNDGSMLYSTYIGGTWNEIRSKATLYPNGSLSVYMLSASNNIFDKYDPSFNEEENDVDGYMINFDTSTMTISSVIKFFPHEDEFSKNGNIETRTQHEIKKFVYTVRDTMYILEEITTYTEEVTEDSSELIRSSSIVQLGEYHPNGTLINATSNVANLNQYIIDFVLNADGSFYLVYGAIDDVSLRKYDSQFNLLWNSTFGGSSFENAKSLIVDSKSQIIVVGSTYSVDFPIINGFDSTYNGSHGGYRNYDYEDFDGYVSVFNATGSMRYSSYFGGNDTEIAYSAVSGSSPFVYISAQSRSPPFELSPPHAFSQYNTPTGYNMLLKLDTSDYDLGWSVRY